MAVDRGVVERIVELFAGLGHIRCRAMFGGLGVYADDLFFALADPDGQLWVKGDTPTSPSTAPRARSRSPSPIATAAAR